MARTLAAALVMAAAYAVMALRRYCSGHAAAWSARWLAHHHGRIGRLAFYGLVLMLVGLPGFALWAAISTYQSGVTARQAGDISELLSEARYQVGQQEALERKYRLEPAAAVRAEWRHSGRDMIDALRRVRSLCVPAERRLIDQVIDADAVYQAVTEHMFTAVDARDWLLAATIDAQQGDPAFDAIEQNIVALADSHHLLAMQQLRALTVLQTRVLIATPLVLALGLGLVAFFLLVLRRSQEQTRQAVAREARSARDNERRFRSLIQNTTDLILICQPSGPISYQSPSAEAAWGYAGDALIGQSLETLLHPDDHGRYRDLWHHVGAHPGATRSVELRLRRSAGEWRYVDLTLSNLLREPAIAGLVTTIKDTNERKAFEAQLTCQAFYDSLTGLPNRALFRDRLTQARLRGDRQHNPLALLFIDLDNFKLTNDSLGHATGDHLLQEAALRLLACVRPSDTVARLGSDEFVVMLERMAVEAEVMQVVTRVLQALGRPFELDGHEIAMSASIGVAFGSAGAEPADHLLRNADVAMYRAKLAGKSRCVVFDPSMHHELLARVQLENDLRHAVDRGELLLYYQPVVHMASQQVTEFEALLRWHHPTRGWVAPDQFIPIAEETGLIVPIGAWVLRTACEQLACWRRQWPLQSALAVNVNLSLRQFQSPNLIEQVADILRETGVPASCIGIGITETVLMSEVEKTVATLQALKTLGIRIGLDDFGTGYSSLAYLKRLPLDILKIDRSFVKEICRSKEDKAIVRGVISLAESLGLAVTAEGIESPEQSDLLAAWGCENAQGFLYGRPMNDAAATALLLRRDTAGFVSQAA